MRVMRRRRDNTRTVDEVYSSSQSNVLPDLLHDWSDLGVHRIKDDVHTLVSPGMGATRQTLPLFNVLMTLLLPTFG
jgi:hypothetical protein